MLDPSAFSGTCLLDYFRPFDMKINPFTCLKLLAVLAVAVEAGTGGSANGGKSQSGEYEVPCIPGYQYPYGS